MEKIDAMPPEIRVLVHEFGSTVVQQFLNVGVTKPRHIRHLIMEVIKEASSQYANGGGNLIVARCADLGTLVGGMKEDARVECCKEFLRSAGVPPSAILSN